LLFIFFFFKSTALHPEKREKTRDAKAAVALRRRGFESGLTVSKKKKAKKQKSEEKQKRTN
jgi:hypothetical protein